MILSIVLVVVLVIAVVAYYITTSIFDGIRAEVRDSLNTIPESISEDLDVLRIFKIID